jgi:hypothetical protein
MNNLYKVCSGIAFTALMLASSIGFTACSDDDLDTNPYNQSGVSLVAMGPMPVSRLDQIRITGTKLDKVNKIIFPAESGINEVEVTDFTLESNQEIKVTVPDAAIPGHVKLVAGSDTITSLSLITYVEPITVSKVSPLTDLSAGDIITIDGEYVYNIATATFTDGVVVEAPDFVYTSRKQVKIAVPKEAVSGELVLSDGDESDPQEFTYNLQINSAEAIALDKDASADEVYEFGDKVTLTGKLLNLVESVDFANYENVYFEVNAAGTQLTTYIPEYATSGTFTLILYSGQRVSSPEYLVPLAEVTSITPNEELKEGDVVTITGKNLDRVQTVTLPGDSILNKGDFTQSESEITFTVPEGMSDGTVTLYQHVNYSVTTDKIKMHHDGAEVVIWSSSFSTGFWGGNQDLAWGGYDWSTVQPGQVLTIYGGLTDPGAYWGCISLRHGTNWGNLPSSCPSQIDWGPDDTSCSVTLTQEIIDDLIANGGLVITGDNMTVTQVTLSVLEEVIWTGTFDTTNWAGNQDLAWGGYDWTTVSAGKTLVVTGYLTDSSRGWGCISLRHGTNWGNLPDPCPSQIDWAPDDTSCELTLTEGILSDIIAGGGLVITGDNITVTKVSLK